MLKTLRVGYRFCSGMGDCMLRVDAGGGLRSVDWGEGVDMGGRTTSRMGNVFCKC